MPEGTEENKPENIQGPQNVQPDQSKAILVLILNILIPGVGTIIYGETQRGVIQLVLLIVGWITTFIIIGIFIILGAWIWALIDGINYYKILSGSTAK